MTNIYDFLDKKLFGADKIKKNIDESNYLWFVRVAVGKGRMASGE
jgi:hypothetical protein